MSPLPKKLFGQPVNAQLLAQATRVYLANQRSSSAKTKTRAEVEGSTRKIFKQKGTGQARHGSVRAPIFVGGGIAHGPTGQQNYQLTMPTKMRKAALISALSDKAAHKQVIVLENEDKYTGKTNQAGQEFAKIAKKTLIITSPKSLKFNRAWRNLDQVALVSPQSVTAYQVMAYPQLLITKTALIELRTRYAA